MWSEIYHGNPILDHNHYPDQEDWSTNGTR
jgi:hypothetical protein